MEVNNDFLQIIQNEHNSVAFVMYSLITRIICGETIVNLHDFHSLNLWRILSGGLGWSSHTGNRGHISEQNFCCNQWIRKLFIWTFLYFFGRKFLCQVFSSGCKILGSCIFLGNWQYEAPSDPPSHHVYCKYPPGWYTRRILHGGEKIWILCSSGMNNISRVSTANMWDIVLAMRRFLTTFRRFPKIFQNCSEGQTNVPEHFPKISVRFSEQIMSPDKYPSIFSRQMATIVYIFSLF